MSKRLMITLIILAIGTLLGVLAIMKDYPIGGLAAYFTSVSVPVLGYFWGETKRPSTKKTKSE